MLFAKPSYLTGGIFLATLAILAHLFYDEWTRVQRHSVNAWSEDQRADCGVVLTGGPNRLREGFDLLAQRRIKKLILSGVNPKSSLREIFPQWPFYGDLRDADVIMERRSMTTYGNVQQSLPLVEALNCRHIVLITSRLHMYRSLKTFKAEAQGKFIIFARAVVGKGVDESYMDVGLEVAKSMFYRLFAY